MTSAFWPYPPATRRFPGNEPPPLRGIARGAPASAPRPHPPRAPVSRCRKRRGPRRCPGPRDAGKPGSPRPRGRSAPNCPPAPQGGKLSAPSVAVVHFHGIGASFRYYEDNLKDLAAAVPGAAVFSLDQPGHGDSCASEAERTLIWSFERHVDVCIDFVNRVREEVPDGVPLAVMGDSMGACLAAHVALRMGGLVSGAVLTAPMLGVEYTPLMRLQSALAPVIAALAPTARIVDGVRDPDLTDEDDVAAWRRTWPPRYLATGKQAVVTARSLESGFRDIQRRRGERPEGRRDAALPAPPPHPPSAPPVNASPDPAP